MEECLTLLQGCFSRFLNCTNGIKSRNAPHMMSSTSYEYLMLMYLENRSRVYWAVMTYMVFVSLESTHNEYCNHAFKVNKESFI